MKVKESEKKGCLGLLSSLLMAANKPAAEKAAADKQKQLEDFHYMAKDACYEITYANDSGGSGWNSYYYAEMKKLAAKLQQLADEAEAAGNDELAELLRNNPLQKAIDSMPNFEEIIANPPGEKALPLPDNWKYGGNLSVPNTPATIPIPPGHEDDPEYADIKKQNEQNKQAPTWDCTTDPIYNAAHELQDTICAMAEAGIPVVEPKTMSPAVAIFVAAILIGLCVAVGYVKFYDPRLVDAITIIGGGTPERMITLQPADEPTQPVREGVGGCFNACDPASPACQEGLTCQPRADGSSICYSAVTCGRESTEQPTETTSSDPSLPQSGCECRGTTLMCADGTIAEFNPACMGGGSGGACQANCICVPDGSQTGGHCQDNPACGCKP